MYVFINSALFFADNDSFTSQGSISSPQTSCQEPVYMNHQISQQQQQVQQTQVPQQPQGQSPGPSQHMQLQHQLQQVMCIFIYSFFFPFCSNCSGYFVRKRYSGTSIVDHSSFELVGRKPICSRTETFFPIRNNGKHFNLFYPKEKYLKY